jgi:pyruvate/2-oxoglutarate/acetoin dehydrogenase E1 component
MGLYFNEMQRAMNHLAEDSRVVFMGQWYGVMPATLSGVSADRKIEMPVVEDMQMGLSTGMALAGFIPVSCFVRWNFLLLAANQLVNHLDKISHMSGGGYQPKVIIRTCVGSTKPLDSRCQHTSDFTDAFELMLTSVQVIRLNEPEDIFPAYHRALTREDGRSTLLVEYGNHYCDK